VICKETFGPDAIARIRQERSILQRLAAVEGVSHLVNEPVAASHSLLLQDVEGNSAAEVLADGRLPARHLLNIALRLAQILERVHAANVMHRDITPDNVVLRGPDLEPVLIDFDLATTFGEVRPALTPPEQIPGQLPFLAPEQTGRTALTVDQRADLYGLGATLYAMATGAPPFGEQEPLRLLHDVLTAVPPPLAEVAPAVGSGLSEIVARLLEKDPSRRYQSAGGLAHDLGLLQMGVLERLAEQDYPQRLLPVSLVGRTAERGQLLDAFARALRSSRRAVLVAGPGGAGKSALVNDVASAATRDRGRFVAVKHDRYRQDNTVSGVLQALQELARMLLGEPEDELAVYRHRIRTMLGDTPAAVAALPELSALLGVEPKPSAPVGPGPTTAHLHETAVRIFRAVATPEKPIVLFLDDLQWATVSGLQFLDALVTDDRIRGLLLVGAYRDAEVVEPGHPLTVLLERWREADRSPALIAIKGLDRNDQSPFVAGLLRMQPEDGSRLSRVLAERCAGNPYDTIELVNALRRDGILRLEPDGWRWDENEIRRYVGQGDVVDLLARRLARLPDETRRCLQLLGSLGSRVALALLSAAAAVPSPDLLDILAPAIEDGLLTMRDPDPAGAGAIVEFRHSRVQQAAMNDGSGSPIDRLAVARRLRDTGVFTAEAVEQYLANWPAINSPGERRLVLPLFRQAAQDAFQIGNYVTAERLLTAACAMADADGGADVETLGAWHQTLYLLGRLEEADHVYDRIGAGTFAGQNSSTIPAGELVAVASVQIDSLLNRQRATDALTLGLEWMGRLGHPLSGDQSDVTAGLEHLRWWAARASLEHDLPRPLPTSPDVLAAAKLINHLLAPSFFADPGLGDRLVVTAHRIWEESGPLADLVPRLASITGSLIPLGDYRTGALVARHVLSVAEQRGFTRAAAQARFLYVSTAKHWAEDIGDLCREAALAREELVRSGDLQSACFTYFPTLTGTLECATTLTALADELEPALVLAARTGNDASAVPFLAYQKLIDVLVHGADIVDAFDDEQSHRLRQSNGPGAFLSFLLEALAAALLDDAAVLRRATQALGPSLPTLTAQYAYVPALLLQMIARTESVLAQEPPDELNGLDGQQIEDWFAARAEEQPINLRHLFYLVRGERAWAEGNLESARTAYDLALRALDGVQRPWHRALTLQRTAKFFDRNGLSQIARALFAEAYEAFSDWGAETRAHQLSDYVGARRRHLPVRGSLGMSSADLDVLAILAASNAISSAVDLHQLRATVHSQLCAVAGATSVLLMVRCGPGDALHLVPGDTDDLLTLAEAEASGSIPGTVVRYVQRTNAQLVVKDAVSDERFARDQYFATLRFCSLLALPVSQAGETIGLVILENTAYRNAFTSQRTDAVRLLGGQLAVSVNNAILYRTLEERIAERTQALQEAKDEVERLSLTDALTGLGNRRQYGQIMEVLWETATAARAEVGVVIIDVDHFKLFNDHYGHLAGDECLRNVSGAIAGAVRATDVVARYGGEEFVVVLGRVDATTAGVVAERVRAAVESLGIPHERSPRGIVTISAGLATMIPETTHPTEYLVERADEALYRAKREGRNRVEFQLG
jgi:diguanylate cyclase (GGDEF)-like protein